ncbi:MAG TPA: gluconate 2-dehydrogenase subunit 3 family protein [Phenylobacterium sp.]|jgi:hypothetical protein|nr:gluconate 2-dehydrogenase subunit 3 family protein [Phenylobacterium sp.]
MSGDYPGYDVLAKWRTASFDEATRRVVGERLAPPPPRRFLSPEEWRLLEAVVARLIPQPDRAEPIPITAWIDARLAEDKGEGYRDARMPPLRPTWRHGLAGIAAEARQRFDADFADLAPERQDELLGLIQRGETATEAWGDMEPARFFRDALLKTAAALYYAHPSAWSEIGFGGPASPRGYVRLGFDERDPWEAKESR